MTTPTVSIPDSEVHSLHSTFVEDDFELWIAKPQPGFVSSSELPAVLYVLDANLCFGTAVEMTRIMHKLYGELPPILVVGIAYPTSDSFRQGMLRNRDFTPSVDNSFADQVDSFLPDQPTANVVPAMGGAERFLRFLREEVQPFVTSQFEVAAENSTIFGSSLGGLFATYTLLKAPDTFDNFIIASPSLWWNQEEIFEMEAEQAAKAEALNSNVFLAVGGLEESPEIPMLAQFKAITNLKKFSDLLFKRNDCSLQMALAILPEETHTSSLPAAMTRGLRSCFRQERLSKAQGVSL